MPSSLDASRPCFRSCWISASSCFFISSSVSRAVLRKAFRIGSSGEADPKDSPTPCQSYSCNGHVTPDGAPAPSSGSVLPEVGVRQPMSSTPRRAGQNRLHYGPDATLDLVDRKQSSSLDALDPVPVLARIEPEKLEVRRLRRTQVLAVVLVDVS